MHCRSGLVSRKGREAAPVFSYATKIAGAAAQPFRGTRPLLQRACKLIVWLARQALRSERQGAKLSLESACSPSNT
ncbi:hypothetical protein EJA05_08365 [Pseudomonas oryziphila]|uniref:Transposase IS116/IS110/IS902 family protein n=2 Tax=Pseudomonas TaxID=286 RepID=A0ABN5TFJ9_9PSED|nr:hypothetical protein EJA05_08365 [Pseudomonas oryziphila]AZL73077.1 hypothetical protein EI693_08205 [Pseudomonas oryziphila]